MQLRTCLLCASFLKSKILYGLDAMFGVFTFISFKLLSLAVSFLREIHSVVRDKIRFVISLRTNFETTLQIQFRQASSTPNFDVQVSSATMSIRVVSDEVEVPSWMDSIFLEKIIKEETKDHIVVIGAEVKQAVPKGNNYLSVLYRVKIRYRLGETVKERAVIIKSPPKGEVMEKVVKEMRCFSKEGHMYSVTLPALHKLLTPHLLGPLCYLSGSLEVLVLEDLNQVGYSMGDRRRGLDLEHCRAVMQGLAYLHASSLALLRSDPICMEMYGESLFDETGKKRMGLMIDNQLTEIASMIDSWPGYERFGDKIRALAPAIMDRIMELVKPQEGRLSVLNHGDCWVNNIMFRYCPISARILDCRFVDFQLLRFSSPALDLQYFLNLSPDLNVRSHHIPQLLQEYHSMFLAALHQLSISHITYPLQQFLKDFQDKNLFGLFTALFVLKLIIADVENIPDLSILKEEDLHGKTEIWSKIAKGERYKTVLQLLLPRFEQDGVL